MAAIARETWGILIITAFSLLLPAFIWGIVLFFRKSYVDIVRKLKAASQADNPQSIIGALDVCIRSFFFSQLASRPEIPPVQEIEAYYDYYHNTVMARVEKASPQGSQEKVAYVGFGLATLVLIALNFHQGLVSLVADGIFIATVLGIIYMLRMSFLYYRESMHLFHEIDIKLTELIGPAEAGQDMAATPRATYENRLQGLTETEDREKFWHDFKRIFPQMYYKMHPPISMFQNKPFPRPATLEECHQAFRQYIVPMNEGEDRFIKRVGIGSLIAGLVSGLLYAISLSNNFMGGYGWVLILVFAAGLLFSMFLLVIAPRDQRIEQEQYSLIEARFQHFLQEENSDAPGEA